MIVSVLSILLIVVVVVAGIALVLDADRLLTASVIIAIILWGGLTTLLLVSVGISIANSAT